MKLSAALLIGATFALPAFGSTRTVTFDEKIIQTDGRVAQMESQGFGFQTSLLYSEFTDITLHDDFGLTETTIARLDGEVFTPKQIDLIAYSNVFRTGNGKAPDQDSDEFLDWIREGVAPQPVLTFTGYLLSGDTVALQIAAGYEFEVSKVLFGDSFANIYALGLSVSFPDSLERSGDGEVVHYFDGSELDGTLNKDWCLNYCAEFVADNLVVNAPANVPLPASGLFLAAAALALAGVRRTRRA